MAGTYSKHLKLNSSLYFLRAMLIKPVKIAKLRLLLLVFAVT